MSRSGSGNFGIGTGTTDAGRLRGSKRPGRSVTPGLQLPGSTAPHEYSGILPRRC